MQQSFNVFNKSLADWLQWSEQQYAEFIYQTGVKYLEAYYENDRDIIKYLAGRAMYWNWWKNLWAKRDEAIIEELYMEDALEIALHLRRSFYQMMHDVQTLCCEIAPNRIVLGNEFIHLKELV